jgi:hypothetical protein
MDADEKLVITWLLEEDASDEAIAFALAHSVYGIDDSSEALVFRLSQADNIRKKLRSLGFEIVHLPPNLAEQVQEIGSIAARTRVAGS